MEDLGNDCRVVRLQGRLDAPGVERLESKFNAAVAAGGHHALVDLGKVDFVASLGLRMFIVAVRAGVRKGKQIVFYGAQPGVRRCSSTRPSRRSRRWPRTSTRRAG